MKKGYSITLAVLGGVALIGLIVYAVALRPRMYPDHYSFIYFPNGEIYVGKLATFPRLALENPYLLVVTKSETEKDKNTFQLTPLSETVWSPDMLYLNEKQILYYGPLDEYSSVVQGIKQTLPK